MTSRTPGNGLTQTFAYCGWTVKVNNIGQAGRLQNFVTGGVQDLNHTRKGCRAYHALSTGRG